MGENGKSLQEGLKQERLLMRSCLKEGGGGGGGGGVREEIRQG